MTTQREPQIGDKIKLTGFTWDAYAPDLRGSVVTIKHVKYDGTDHREALFDYTDRFGETEQTFVIPGEHRRENPQTGESWHFADEPRIGDLVKLTGRLWTDAAKEEGPYRVHEYKGDLVVSPHDHDNYRLNVPTWKGLWDVEVLSERPGLTESATVKAPEPEELKLEVGAWIKFKPGTGIDHYHPEVYSVASLGYQGVGVNIPASELTGAVNDRVCFWWPDSMTVVPAPGTVVESFTFDNGTLNVGTLNTEPEEDQTVTFEAYDADENIAIGDWVVVTNKAYGTRHPGVYKVVDRTEFGVGGVEVTIQRDVDRKFRAGVNDFRKATSDEYAGPAFDELLDSVAPIEYDAIDPDHYKGFSNGAEPIDIIEHLTPNKGTAVKYLARAGRKPDAEELQDLRKALRYIQREINLIEGNPSW